MGKKSTNNMENCGRDGVAIDVKALTYSMDTLKSENFVMSPACCIFKTPNILSRHNEKAYAPNAFSIGPWHLGKPHLEATQKIKKKYLYGLICRLSSYPGSPSYQEQLSRLEYAIEGDAKKAHECYAEPVGCSIEDLVKILVLDGCFIIELFRKKAEVLPKDDMTKDPADSKPLHELAIRFFRYMIPRQYTSRKKIELLHRHKIKHIIDLLWNWWSLKEEESGEGSHQTAKSGDNESSRFPRLPCATSLRMAGINCKDLISKAIQKLYKGNQTSESGENKKYIHKILPCATSLREAGIKFKKSTSKSIFHIKFENGVLEIPPLVVQESTETILRNIISFEQCDPNCLPIFTSYAVLMDQLIESAKDMEILCKKEIIHSWLTLEDASKFFDKLYIDTYVKKFYYKDLYKKVNEYCPHRRPRWRANLMHNYFNTPWAVVGIVVAGLLLVLTIIGTVCSIIQTT